MSLDLTWLRDDSLEDLDNLPSPDLLAAEIAEELKASLTAIEALSELLERSEVVGSELSHPFRTLDYDHTPREGS